MTTTTLTQQITGGADDRLDVHVEAALDEGGGLLGVESFPTTPKGYAQLRAFLECFGKVDLLGVEHTGSHGAGSTLHLHRRGVKVVGVDPPNRQRQRQRRQGRSAPQDAISGARAAQGGNATGKARARDRNVGALRVLRVARASARKGRTQAVNQMPSLISTGPDCIRAELLGLHAYPMPKRTSALRPATTRDLVPIHKLTVRMLANRAHELEAEVSAIDAIMDHLVVETAPALVAMSGVGTEMASALLVAVGDNPERLRNEASFPHCCGTSLIDASSGKRERHRLNRSGDRQANSALWHIVITRMVSDPRTRHHIERRMKDGLTKKEAIRCLKRYIAREVFTLIPVGDLAFDSP